MAHNKLLKFQDRKTACVKAIREKKDTVSRRATGRLAANYLMTLWNLEDNEMAFFKC